MMTSIYQFLSGATMLGSWVVGAFFMRFWTKTKDRLFFHFGLAFYLFTIERALLSLTLAPPSSEAYSLLYLFRLVGFLLIIYAIIDKNRKDHEAT